MVSLEQSGWAKQSGTAKLSISERRQRAAVAGHTSDEVTARLAVEDENSSVRVVGLGALARLGVLRLSNVETALRDEDSVVARRAIEVIAPFTLIEPDAEAQLDALLVAALTGPDDAVAEVAAWAMGERHQETAEAAPTAVVGALTHAATNHNEALVRESAAAALGSIGHLDGLPAILIACRDKATVRRRAIIALAAFDGPEVTDALQRALSDRDWQVRQAAEDQLAIAADPSEQI